MFYILCPQTIILWALSDPDSNLDTSVEKWSCTQDINVYTQITISSTQDDNYNAQNMNLVQRRYWVWLKVRCLGLWGFAVSHPIRRNSPRLVFQVECVTTELLRLALIKVRQIRWEEKQTGESSTRHFQSFCASLPPIRMAEDYEKAAEISGGLLSDDKHHRARDWHQVVEKYANVSRMLQSWTLEVAPSSY